MFDWLLGSGGKDRQALADQQAQANDVYGQYDKWFNGLSEDQRNQFNTQAGGNFLDTLKNETVGAADTAWNDYSKTSRNDTFGNGILGALLNPFAQTATAAGDLATGQYQKKGRDVMSDLGALGESALTFLPGAGMIGKAGKVGKALTSVPGLAATNAGFGGLEAVRQGGSETQLQDVLSQAGMGAAFGGGIPLAGKLLKGRGSKVLQKGMASRGMDDEMIKQTMGAIPNRALYYSAVKSFVPKSTIGKVAAGGGAAYGIGSLLNQGGQQPAADPSMMMQNSGDMTEEQLYNYLISQGAI